MTMKTYALVATASGSIVRRQQFEDGQQPQLAAAKGLRWIVDNGAGADAGYKAESTPIAADATEVPYAFRSLAACKTIRILAARAILAQKLTGTFTHNGHAYQLGPDATGRWAMDNITAMGAAAGMVVDGVTGATWPQDFAFVDAANADVAMTAAEMLAMSMAARDYVYAARRNFWDLRTSILAANSVAAVLAIDITAGWP